MYFFSLVYKIAPVHVSFLTYVRNNMHILLTYVKNNVYNPSYSAL